MDLHNVVAITDLESLVSVPAHRVICPNVSSGVLFCCFSCPCMQAAVHSVALSYAKCLNYPFFSNTYSPEADPPAIPHNKSNCGLGCCCMYQTAWDGLALFSVIHLICRCVRRSWSHTSGSARSSTRQTYTHTFPHAGQRGCCTHAHSRGGCSHRVPLRCGYIPFPESQGCPVFGLPHSNLVICSHTAGPLSQLVFFAGFSLSCVAFFSVCLISVCCFHTYPLKNGQSCQRTTLFSNRFSQHRTQKHRDNGSPLTSALLQPESKGRMTFGCGLSFIGNTAWHLEIFNITAVIMISVMGKPEYRRIHVMNQVSSCRSPLWDAWSLEVLCICTLERQYQITIMKAYIPGWVFIPQDPKYLNWHILRHSFAGTQIALTGNSRSGSSDRAGNSAVPTLEGIYWAGLCCLLSLPCSSHQDH